MLARLYIKLPFSLTIPDGEEFPIHEYTDSGYKIKLLPPGMSGQQGQQGDANSIKMEGKPAFQADALYIEFYKSS